MLSYSTLKTWLSIIVLYLFWINIIFTIFELNFFVKKKLKQKYAYFMLIKDRNKQFLNLKKLLKNSQLVLWKIFNVKNSIKFSIIINCSSHHSTNS